MKFKYIMLSICLINLSGCAALQQMHEQWVKENCNTSAAFNSGLADGLQPDTSPKRSYADSCPSNQQAINDAYINGFTQGLQKRPQQINIEKNVNVKQSNAVSKVNTISLDERLRAEDAERRR